VRFASMRRTYHRTGPAPRPAVTRGWVRARLFANTVAASPRRARYWPRGLVVHHVRKAERTDHGHSGGKISGGLAFYDSIAFDEPWNHASPRASDTGEENSRIEPGQQGAG